MPTDVTRTSTLDRLLRAGGMFIRDGSGAIGSLRRRLPRPPPLHRSPHQLQYCLGAHAVVNAAGGSVNGYLTTDTLLKGNQDHRRTAAAPLPHWLRTPNYRPA
jgi:hypothetical protein